ncbi:peptidyl-tRNA hydrolase II [Rhodofomes roseus]|uniref:peptidyl-tRNA hydrolase n=1 Tax=Rhodofomes roseus TaxID=34475 RepID=A0ABQ8K9N3_9APHY|nr:peptidyl-tRNA hydrolase II [Rhodofomes roseus]KAH9834060.1 peptidyl-tRNA hydrolase II [Rhodofomes roseus]
MSQADSSDAGVPAGRTSSEGLTKEPEVVPEPQPLVMQIVVRRDLLDIAGWGVGPLMAQTAHATAAVLYETRDLPETKAYLDDLKNMRKAVLQVADRKGIEKLAALLSSADPPVLHHLWVEQPENEPSCLALAPNRRESRVKRALDKSGCRLWKG